MKLSNMLIKNVTISEYNDLYVTRYWNTYLQSTYNGMWYATIGSGDVQYNEFISISSNFISQSIGNTSIMYSSSSQNGISFSNYTSHSLNLYDSGAHGATYNGASTVRPISIATNSDNLSSVRYIITFASAGGTTEDVNNGIVPTLGVSFYLWSSDSQTWNRNSMPHGNWRRIYNINGTWIALSYIPSLGGGALPDSKYCISSDGLNWTLYNFPVAYRTADIAFNGTNYVVTGINMGTKVSLVSNDLINWTIITLPGVSLLNLGAGIASGNGVFIIAIFGDSRYILKSTDGYNWQLTNTDIINGQGFSNIKYVNNKFVIVTAPGNNIIGETYYTNDDGLTWITVNNQPSSFYSISTYNNKLLGLGFNSNYTAVLDFS